MASSGLFGHEGQPRLTREMGENSVFMDTIQICKGGDGFQSVVCSTALQMFHRRGRNRSQMPKHFDSSKSVPSRMTKYAALHSFAAVDFIAIAPVLVILIFRS